MAQHDDPDQHDVPRPTEQIARLNADRELEAQRLRLMRVPEDVITQVLDDPRYQPESGYRASPGMSDLSEVFGRPYDLAGDSLPPKTLVTHEHVWQQRTSAEGKIYMVCTWSSSRQAACFVTLHEWDPSHLEPPQMTDLQRALVFRAVNSEINFLFQQPVDLADQVNALISFNEALYPEVQPSSLPGVADLARGVIDSAFEMGTLSTADYESMLALVEAGVQASHA